MSTKDISVNKLLGAGGVIVFGAIVAAWIDVYRDNAAHAANISNIKTQRVEDKEVQAKTDKRQDDDITMIVTAIMSMSADLRSIRESQQRTEEMVRQVSDANRAAELEKRVQSQRSFLEGWVGLGGKP